MRLFCAVELPSEVQDHITDYVNWSRGEFAAAAGVRWERREKLHITLQFFGEVEDGRIAELSRVVEEAAGVEARFSVSVEGTGTFPPRGRTRIFWLGVRDDAGGLMSLQRRLATLCAPLGFEPEARAFHPHVTIGRTRRADASVEELARRHRAARFDTAHFEVRELVLISSELGTSGSRYTPLSRHALATNQE